MFTHKSAELGCESTCCLSIISSEPLMNSINPYQRRLLLSVGQAADLFAHQCSEVRLKGNSSHMHVIKRSKIC